ncbi:MAG: FHA domain-containing protein [Myxococcaceae bacterium]
MKSYLLSSLVFRFSSSELDAFTKVHTHDWLLWEPGAWKPPASTTAVMGSTPVPKQPTPPPGSTPVPGKSAGEALALAMEPRKDGKPITLGRGSDCDAVINDGTLSQIHLVFMRDDKGWTVRDAGSRNGSSVDGVKLQPGKPIPLRAGMRVLAAQVAFTFYDAASMLARLKA